MSATIVQSAASFPKQLDVILFDMKKLSPEREAAYTAWLQDSSSLGDTVLLRPHNLDGSIARGVKVNIDGQEINFPPSGQRVSKRIASRLLRMHGRNGQYTGRDRRSGFTRTMLEEWPEELVKRYDPEQMNFNEFYLSHWTEDMIAAEKAEREAAKAAEQQESENAE